MERYVYSELKSFVPQERLDLFRRNIVKLKAGFDKRNRRFFNTPAGQRLMIERSLVPSSTTLIIVPDALLEHWAEQIKRHVNLKVFADPNNNETPGGSRGVVWVDGVGDLSTARSPMKFDEQMPMPSAFHLIGHVIVVVPFSKVKQQYGPRKRSRNGNAARDNDENPSLKMALLQVRWFRIVVDEGHELGENEAESEVTACINEMAAGECS
jgi:SNF2 family DNA or RNA helicase